MTLLLVVIYTAFIGLGVPDSLIGSAWPSIHEDLSLPVDAVSIITLLISGATVLSGLFSARVLNKLGTPIVTALSTALTAVALFGFSLSPNIYTMLPLAVALGLGAGAIDAGLNNYVALHFSARQMNLLHCFYGIGVTVSPYIMSLALSNSGWRSGYRYAALIQLVISIVVFLSLPLWKKTKNTSQPEEDTAKNLTLPELVRTPGIIIMWVIMLSTNALEYAAGVWGGTYLVKAHAFTVEDGAAALSLYYAGLAVGRLISGLVSRKVGSWHRIFIGLSIVLAAVILLILPLPSVVSVIGLMLIGLGNGSIYPNLIHLTPHNFGRETSQSVMGSLIAFAYIGVMLSPPLVGFVTSTLNITAYPYVLALLFVIMTVSVSIFALFLRRRGKFDTTV